MTIRPQAAAAQRLLEDRASVEEPAFVDRIALVELVWVLQRRYGYGREAIADALIALLRTPSCGWRTPSGLSMRHGCIARAARTLPTSCSFSVRESQDVRRWLP